MASKTKITAQKILQALDYAVLKPEATLEDLQMAATYCEIFGIGCLCVKSVDVPAASQLLEEVEDVTLAAVVGFPHGNVGRQPTP